MLNATNRDEIRDQLGALVSGKNGLSQADKRRIRRVADGGRIFDRFSDHAEKQYRTEKKLSTTAAIDPSSFMKWIIDWVKNNPDTIAKIIAQIIKVFFG